MKIDQDNFAQLVSKAMQDENMAHLRAVIEKELLHYDILFALDKFQTYLIHTLMKLFKRVQDALLGDKPAVEFEM